MEFITSMFLNVFRALKQFGFRDIIDISIIAVCIYKLLQAIKETRAIQVFKGIGIVLIAAILADFFKLSAVSWVLSTLLQSGVIVALVLFQPEIRKALEGIGRGSVFNRSNVAEGEERIISELTSALLELSKRKIGALIVFQQRSSLSDIIKTGTTINADICSPLILNIFEPNTPLHDGAMIISEGRIVAAGCFLPLSDNMTISKELGTRHRAGLGISEHSDSITFIVSEETGVISYTSGGKLIRYMDQKSIGDTLLGIYGSEEEKKKLAALSFIRRKKNNED